MAADERGGSTQEELPRVLGSVVRQVDQIDGLARPGLGVGLVECGDAVSLWKYWAGSADELDQGEKTWEMDLLGRMRVFDIETLMCGKTP